MPIDAMINIILTITMISVLAWLNSLLSYFLDYCMWPGNIFKHYLPWLGEMLLNNDEWEEVRLLQPSQRAEEYMRRGQSKFLFKMLGGCIICTNFWISIGTFIVLYNFINLQWYLFIPYFLVSHFSLRKITSI